MINPEYSQEAIALLKDLISIQSFSREEESAADFLQNYIELKGCSAYRKDNNIWVMSPGFDLSKKTILLNSHIDTVKPVSAWSIDPYIPVEEGDKLFGLGSNDAGASVVALLHAFLYLTEKAQTYNLIFAATAEEEVSGQNGIVSLMQELPPVDIAIVGEPTGMHAAVAEKGLMVLDCTARGVAGHAARNEGENAIYKALKDIEWFKSFDFPLQTEFLGPVKMSVTQITAGTQHNVVPDKCTFVVDVRSNEMYANEEILNIIRSHVESEVNARSTRLSSTASPLEHPLLQRIKEMGREFYGSPTLSDQSLMKFPSVKLGPGDSARSHTANEYILMSEIQDAVQLYVDILDGLVL